MPRINPNTNLVFHPLRNEWVVELPDGTTEAFAGGWTGRIAAGKFIDRYNASATATA